MNELNITNFSKKDQKLILKGYYFAKKMHDTYTKPRLSGEPYFTHPVAVAKNLIAMGSDATTVTAGLLHDVIEDTIVTKEQLAHEFGSEIANLVDSVTKVTQYNMPKDQITLATDRKFLTALLRDHRTALIKLADRLHNMRTANAWKKETQMRKAKENFAVYIPVAKEIGAWRIKQELEDISFQILQPEEYQLNSEKVSYIKEAYNPLVNEVKENIASHLAQNKIEPMTIKTQFITPWSMYQSLSLKSKQILELKDLISLKIIVNSQMECYQTLGIVNDLYKAKKVTDYISNAKPNSYQSLHAHIVVSDQFNLLVKIRDPLMERKATYGISNADYRQIGGIKLFQVIETLDDNVTSDKDFLEKIGKEFYGEKVSFFTPNGTRCELPHGATLVDAAYFIHTDIGKHMIKASVNGVIKPDNYKIREGETIRIFTNGEVDPTEEQLKNAKTNYAKAAINRALKRKI